MFGQQFILYIWTQYHTADMHTILSVNTHGDDNDQTEVLNTEVLCNCRSFFLIEKVLSGLVFPCQNVRIDQVPLIRYRTQTSLLHQHIEQPQTKANIISFK